jgi:hypothetical protein
MPTAPIGSLAAIAPWLQWTRSPLATRDLEREGALCDGPPQSTQWNRIKRSSWRMWGADVPLVLKRAEGFRREPGASQILRGVIALAIVISAIENSRSFGNLLTPQRSVVGHEACACCRGDERIIGLSTASA